MVRADELDVTGINRPGGGDRGNFHTGEKIDYANFHPQLDDAVDQGLPEQLNPNYPTATGRFRDVNTDRVLALQMSRLGSDTLLSLASPSSFPGTATGQQDCASVVGNICSFRDETADSVAVTDEANTNRAVAMTPSNNALNTQRWTVVSAGDGAGYVQLVSDPDGLCLTALGVSRGDQVGTRPCVLSGVRPVTQLWKSVRLGNTGHTTLLSKTPDMELVGGANDGDAVTIGGPYSGEFTSVAVVQPAGGAIRAWSTVLPGIHAATPFALATGDVDRIVGSDKGYHDEAVAAYADAAHRLQLRVVDYNADAGHLLATAPDVALPEVGGMKGGRWYPGSVGVAVGDFAGSGARNQIAVTWQDGSGLFHLTLLSYAATPGGGRALSVIGQPTGTTLFSSEKTTNSLASGYAQTSAGAFDGDGRADVAIAYAASNPGTSLLSGHLGVASLTSDFHLRAATTTQFSVTGELVNNEKDGGTWTPRGIRMAPGLFRYDASTDHDFQRRQLALAWDEAPVNGGHEGVAVYDVGDSPHCTSDTCDLTVGLQIRDFYYDKTVDRPIPMAVGGFQGIGKGGDPPIWDIVLGQVSPAVGPALLVYRPPASSDEQFREFKLQPLGAPVTADTQLVLTATDRAGASLALGAPLVYAVTNVVKDTLIAAQPPAHSDWLDGHFINVSRVGDFHVTLTSTQTKKYTHTTTHSAGFSDGLTQSADLQESYRFGTKEDNVTAAGEIKEKFAKNWTHSSANFTKYSTTITSTATTTGSDDDIVQALIETDYMYRYPVLGPPPTGPDGKPAYQFYQVKIPGQVVKDDGLGRALSFYQPSWENGNALSYPKLVGGQVQIPDLGSYSYTDDDGMNVPVNAALFNTMHSVGGGSSTDELEITGQTSTGNTTESGTNLDASVEVKATVSAQVDDVVSKEKSSLTLGIGYQASRTTGVQDDGSNSATSSNSFALDIPTITSNKGYQIGTAYYYDTAGVPKVVHGVDLTADANSSQFWQLNYGQAPDPALNLPDASYLTYDEHGLLIVPQFSTLATRQLIRGFEALQPYDPNSPMTSGQPYATTPQEGDPVTFAVQLHDYSLVDSPTVPVHFYAVPTDATGLKVTGAPEPSGTVTSPAIPSQGAVTVTSPAWIAKGPASGQSIQNWRIFVVADPDDTLNEIHPWQGGPNCPEDALDPDAPAGTVVDGKMVDPMTGQPETLACGQNNQGYGTIAVIPRTSRSAPVATTIGGTPPGNIGTRLDASGLVSGTRTLLGRSQKTAVTPTIRVGQPVTGLVYANSTTNSAAIQPVLIYDGPPAAGKLIASTTLAGATRANGGTAQYTWRPSTLGLHTIYQVLVGTDPAGNSQQTMQVNVVADLSAGGPPNPVTTSPRPTAAPHTTAGLSSPPPSRGEHLGQAPSSPITTSPGSTATPHTPASVSSPPPTRGEHLGPAPSSQPSTDSLATTSALASTGAARLAMLVVVAVVLIVSGCALMLPRRRRRRRA